MPDLYPATGKSTGCITLPEDLTSLWTNLRGTDKYVVGCSGPNILCVDRRTCKLLWRVETYRPALSIALGADKVFCSEPVNPKRGEDANEDGSIFARYIASGEEVWRRNDSATLRYSQSLDIVVTPKGFYCGSKGDYITLQSGVPPSEFIIKGRGLPETGMPAYIAGNKLLAGNEETLIADEFPSGKQISQPVRWVQRGCTVTRASRHLLTTRCKGNSAWSNLENGEITPLLSARPGCQINNNLYPADGVLNIPNLTAGCTCNYTLTSAACIPASVVRCDGKSKNILNC